MNGRIYLKPLYVELYREHTFSTDKKGSGKVDLNNIRRGTAIKNDCKIEIESKRVEPIVNFVITPILPEGKKYYETVSKEAIKITKIFPPFTGKQHVELENSNAKTSPSQATPPTAPAKGGNAQKNPPPAAKNPAPGKRLDFICQEMNREINTIGSKNQFAEVGAMVITAKDSLENIREQSNNVE